MDSFSFSFWGHRSENWAKKICCHLQNLNSKATVLQRRCMFVVAQWVALLSKRTYQQKRLVSFNHEKALCHPCCTGNNGHNTER